MNKVLYLDCSYGISGDMFVAAMLDLGADQEILLRALDSLFISGYEIKISRVNKSGFEACDFLVALDDKHENHDHDMEYLHGNTDKSPETIKIHHDRERRNLNDVAKIIDRADMTFKAKKLAMKIFTILAEAEAKAHGVLLEEVTFHEVGAVDSIVDIVSAAVCFDALGIEKTIIPFVCDGTGTIRCRNGWLNVPVPAVRIIDEKHKLNLKITDVEGELVTPTGAAIAAAIRTDTELPLNYTIQKSGIGAGKRKYKCPGILRAMLIDNISY